MEEYCFINQEKKLCDTKKYDYIYTKDIDIDFIKELIRLSSKFQNISFPIQYFGDEVTSFKGVIFPKLAPLMDLSKISMLNFYCNIYSLQFEFYKLEKLSIYPKSVSYDTTKCVYDHIYVTNTLDFFHNDTFSYEECYNTYIYDLIKNIVSQYCYHTDDIQLVTQYLKKLAANKFCIDYIQEDLLYYSNFDEYFHHKLKKVLRKEKKCYA